MRKILASLVLALSLIVPTVISAAPAQAATPPPAHLHVSDNKTAFNDKHKNAFKIRVTAHHRNGKALNGQARLYVNGKHLRTRVLQGGRVVYHVGRSSIPNNRVVKVKVRVMPWNDQMRDRIVIRHVIDRPPPRPKSGSIVSFAKKQVGKRYVFGTAGPRTFDCSGLVKFVYRHAAGKNLPHSSAAQRHSGRRVSSPQPGDLVYTEGHISIYAGNGMVVEAASPKTGVRYTVRWQHNPVYIRP